MKPTLLLSLTALLALGVWAWVAIASANLERDAQCRDWVDHALDAYEANQGLLADTDLQGKDFAGVVACLMNRRYLSEDQARAILSYNRHAAPGDQLYVVHDGRSMFHVTSRSLEAQDKRVAVSS